MIGTVVDIETTGYLSFEMVDGWSRLANSSEILEVGFMNINMDTKAILTYGTLYFYKPYFNVESDAQRVHGITREFIAQYENDFTRNLIAPNSLMQRTCVIGKNSDTFDIPFIKAFIEKHGGDKMNIPNLVDILDMKRYDGGHLLYDDNLYALDLQKLFKEKYHDLYYEKNKVKLQPAKKGTLSQYIEVIPSGQEAVDVVYNGLKKDRVTGAHGALYDVVMTYIVWCYCRNAGIC